MADEDILFGCEGNVATVTLNRPQALNAFTLDMYRRFDPMLRAWAEDSSVKAVLIRAADALYCRFATHFVPRERVPALIAALIGSGGVEETLAGFAADPGPAPIRARQPAIDRCFAGDTVEAILDALEREATEGGANAEWAAETRAGLMTKSPTSLKITLRQLITGRDFAIEEALALEYRLTQHVMAGHDFYEGVRAVLVDKDQQPRWDPPTLAGVDEAMVDSYFAPLGEAELRFD